MVLSSNPEIKSNTIVSNRYEIPVGTRIGLKHDSDQPFNLGNYRNTPASVCSIYNRLLRTVEFNGDVAYFTGVSFLNGTMLMHTRQTDYVTLKSLQGIKPEITRELEKIMGVDLPRSVIVGCIPYTENGDVVLGKRTHSSCWNLFGGTVSPSEMKITSRLPVPLEAMLNIELEEELGIKPNAYHSTPKFLQTMKNYHNRVEVIYSTQIQISNDELLDVFESQGNKHEHTEIRCLSEEEFQAFALTEYDNFNLSLQAVCDKVF